MVKTIGNPGTWAVGAVGSVFGVVPRLLRRVGGETAVPQMRNLTLDDVRDALRDGVEDFMAFRSDVLFACLLYPLIGLILAWFAFDNALLPLLFPLVAGFALLGPLAAIGLYEMSKRRARGEVAHWSDGFALLNSPSIGAIVLLGVVLFGLFLVWLGAAGLIYNATLGPEPPASITDLLTQTFTTSAGWTMIIVGFAVGGVFAALVLSVSLISFPMLVDRDVGVVSAIVTSVQVTAANPGPVAIWGLIVAVALAFASIPLFLGLIFVMPVLGHATWHLYRRAIRHN